MKKIIYLYLLALVMPVVSMEAPASFNSLSPDVKRLVIPMIASSKVHEVAKTILSLNATNRFFHNYINNPKKFITILERMPYAANAVDLVELLRNMPVVRRREIVAWRKQVKLEGGKELFAAASLIDPSISADRANSIDRSLSRLENILRNRNIDLNWMNPEHEYQTALARASLYEINIKKVELLLAAGASVNLPVYGRSPLWEAVYQGNKEIAEKLIQAGARVQTDIIAWAVRRGHINVIQLLQDALVKQQKGLNL